MFGVIHAAIYRAGHIARQRGSYAITVSVMLGAVSIMVLSFSSIVAKRAEAESGARRASEVAEVLTELQVWYQLHADELARTPEAPSQERLTSALSRPYPGIRVAMSSSQAPANCSSGSATILCMPWRKIAAWYPASVPVANPEMVDSIPVGEFTDDAVWRVYSSQSWDYERYTATLNKMGDIGRGLMTLFSAKQAANPDQVVGVNFWRASNCANPSGQLPCWDSYTDVVNTSVMNPLGFGPSDVTPPMASAIQISNLQDSSNSPPYSIALQLVTPSGQKIKQIVVQP